VFHCTGGLYSIYGNSVYFRDIQKGELVYISIINGELVIMDGELNHRNFQSVNFSDKAGNSQFRLKLVDPVLEPRDYSGQLYLTVLNGFVQMINQVHLDEYLAGVIESEGGSTAPLEYYKAQAILCRSYAIKNWDRHPGQDFNLCDNTHCQAFRGLCTANPSIYDAVIGTHGVVMTDMNFKIASAIFHSNSGGETQRAQDVWDRDESYLQAVIDPFSEGLRSSDWVLNMPLQDWKNYLAAKFKDDLKSFSDQQLMIRQDHRLKYFIAGNDSLRLTDIRADLNLRSTFFTMYLKGDNILFSGKGYGHGVGMSQEGAIEMARQGYSASDILRFYYYNVRVTEMSEIPDSELPGALR
jgi:stage II sporulation protein D